MKERALRIFSNLTEAVDAIVLMNDQEPMADAGFFYATGVGSGLFEECPAVLWPDGRVQLLTSRLEETSARASSADIQVFFSSAEREALLQEMLKGVKRLGINGPGITYRGMRSMEKAAPGVRFVDVEQAISKARMIKDHQEVENIREACRIASRVADHIPDLLRLGMPEYEAAAELGYRMQKLGASSVSFDTIAAFGPGSAEPHYVPGDRRLQAGDLALFDFGCRHRRYCSDITRTFVAAPPGKQAARMHEVVLEAQGRAIEAVRAGAAGSDVDAAARSFIDSTEFKGRLIHSTGHGLGLNVHDGGRLAPNIDLVLEENMVMTVEPGVYLPGVGGVRIEDDVLVTRSGCEVLTSAKKELRAI